MKCSHGISNYLEEISSLDHSVVFLYFFALISHASKVMLKSLQASLQQYVNHELPDIQAGFRKDRGTREQIANICWIIEKAREFLKKNIYFCFIDYKATVQTGHGTKDWLVPNRKRSVSRLYIVPCLFNLYAEYNMRNAGLEEAQAGMKIAGSNINNLRYADDTTLVAESEEELEPLDESERGE